jgi:hypothetical protein
MAAIGKKPKEFPADVGGALHGAFIQGVSEK